MKQRQSIIQKILSPIATTLMGFVGGGYTATDPRRKLLGNNHWNQNKASANTLLSAAGPLLRSHCRNLERNNPTARAGIEAITGLVIGTGIALEPETGDDALNAQVRSLFNRWMATVGVDGCDIYHLQTQAMREVATVGEALWRIVPDPNAKPGDPFRLRVLPLESEWLSDTEAMSPAAGCTMAAGMALDKYGRPVAYYLQPPEIGRPEEVPARSIIHIFERRRPLQCRGEPWLAPVIETLMNERDLVDAELYAAKQTAAMALVITAENHDAPDTTEDGDDEDPAQAVRLGGVARLYPGEDIKAFGHTRPSQQIAPFRQMLRGDIAAALRIPQRYLDRDVGRANYSSMRCDMLDTERLLSPVREFMGHQTIGALYRLAAPILSAAVGRYIDPNKYRLLPDAQPYIDPQKDVTASADAIAKGLSTKEAEISKRGGDWRQVQAQASAEAVETARAEIARLVEIQKMVNAANEAAPGLNLNWAQVATLSGAATAPGAYLTAATGNQQAVAPVTEAEDSAEDDDIKDAESASDTEDDTEEEDMKPSEMRAILEAFRDVQSAERRDMMQVLAQNRAPAQPGHVIHTDMRAEAIREVMALMEPPTIQVNVPAPVVHVAAPTVTVEAARVDVPAAQITVNVPEAPAPVVNVAAPAVTVENTVEVPARTIKATPQRDGSVIMEPQE